MSFLRRLVERLSRGVILERRMPREFGGATILVSPDVSLRYWKPGALGFERELMLLARDLVRPGAVVWDIGASVGLFSFAAAFAAGSGGRVLAVEADPWVAGLVERSATILPRGHAPVAVLPVAIADRWVTTSFSISARGRASSRLVEVQGSSFGSVARGNAMVEARTLDSLLELSPSPDLVKIDIEGAEALAFSGADEVLAAGPVILCEVHDPNVASVTAKLAGHGFHIFDAEEKIRPRTEISRAAFNTLAIPASSTRRKERDN